jgi:NitT/TauT family transport system substrate-binding protein
MGFAALRLAFIGLAVAAALGLARPAMADVSLRFTLDWKFEGPQAPYLLAIDNGFYRSEGLNVSVEVGPGSVAGIGRVAAGEFPFGIFDINSLVRFRDQNPDKRVRAVLMIYDRPPFAIISTARSEIDRPQHLEGKTIGAPAGDAAYAQWRSFAQVAGIDASKVKIADVGFPVRESMLAAGHVDAVTGFSFSSVFTLRELGVKPGDIRVMLMADHGLALYGNAVMVNADFARTNPKQVSAFVRATIRGVLETARDPSLAIKSLLKRNPTADARVERSRLEMALNDNLITPYTRANGFGGVDMARLATSIKQIGISYEYKNPILAEDIFTSEFLPPVSRRMP